MSTNNLNISEVMERMEELQALFELGQQTMPFLEQLFHFIEDIEPLLDEINASIRESTHKMPHAKSKLQSVSQATELATTEILDLVDAAQSELRTLSSTLNATEESIEAIRAADVTLLNEMREALPADHAVLASAEALHNKKGELIEQCLQANAEKQQAVRTVREKMTQIMMALQVQDITSQQIAAVNHIIESLRDRMTRLVSHPSVDASEDGALTLESDGTFDLDARYEPTGNHQSVADDLINSFQKNGNAEPADASEDEEESGSGEMASQEDIDALFG